MQIFQTIHVAMLNLNLKFYIQNALVNLYKSVIPIITLEPNLDVVFTLNNGDENSSGEFIVGAGNYLVTLNYVDPNYENCATNVEVQVVDPDPLSLEISVTEAFNG